MEKNECNARFNNVIPCKGNYIEAEGCCERHAMLFDVWICEHKGHKVYGFKGSTDGRKDEESLRRWKRAQFHRWLNKLTVERVDAMLMKKA